MTQSAEDGNKLYRNTAGEIMAKDTAERRKFSCRRAPPEAAADG